MIVQREEPKACASSSWLIPSAWRAWRKTRRNGRRDVTAMGSSSWHISHLMTSIASEKRHSCGRRLCHTASQAERARVFEAHRRRSRHASGARHEVVRRAACHSRLPCHTSRLVRAITEPVWHCESLATCHAKADAQSTRRETYHTRAECTIARSSVCPRRVERTIARLRACQTRVKRTIARVERTITRLPACQSRFEVAIAGSADC